ncbi:hypothetical protein [Thorsellia anophelis]|uniref:Uncharacterized protein n=1 Tax=Thorsellia anophelis DSM 18579 TaxID=1123402 RepID=A0A1I0CBX1_9GAMM|nr:hypothetical protein [Thorsellia anophelis]SET17042.1 hypothetical protein SAMN02583745_01570 [Thorsellia anophelis DSM 18579]
MMMSEYLFLTMASMLRIVEGCHCLIASYYAIKIYQKSGVLKLSFYERLLSWMLFVSFACIPIVVFFGVYGEYAREVLIINLIVISLIWLTNRFHMQIRRRLNDN